MSTGMMNRQLKVSKFRDGQEHRNEINTPQEIFR
jgi:hypothetical protein